MRVLMSVTSWDASLVQTYLREEGIFVTATKDGGDIFASLNLLGRPVVILETNLPDLNWVRVLKQLRLENRNMSIFVFNTKKCPTDQRVALEGGADDVITPGMQGAEIAARIRAVMARRAGHAGPNITIGPMRLRMAERRAFWGPQKIDLTSTQYNIFETICLASPYSVSRHVIMAELYGVEEGGASETINVFISYLRSRLIAAGAPWQTIETIPGRGYRLSQFDPDQNFLTVATDKPAAQDKTMLERHRAA